MPAAYLELSFFYREIVRQFLIRALSHICSDVKVSQDILYESFKIHLVPSYEEKYFDAILDCFHNIFPNVSKIESAEKADINRI